MWGRTWCPPPPPARAGVHGWRLRRALAVFDVAPMQILCARTCTCARTSSPPSRLQSLEEIEAILVKTERSMNELKCKIAAETQSIRFMLSRAALCHAVPVCSAAPSISCAASEQRCPSAAHPVMISPRSTACSLPNSHPTPAWVTQAGRGEHRHCAPAGRANTILAACRRFPPALGHEVVIRSL